MPPLDTVGFSLGEREAYSTRARRLLSKTVRRKRDSFYSKLFSKEKRHGSFLAGFEA
jgi:hypothetical protein